MKIIIETIENGYLATIDDERMAFTDDGYEPSTFDRFKATSNEEVAIGLLLEYIAESLGKTYDKYSADNISITFDKKGHKYESPTMH